MSFENVSRQSLTTRAFSSAAVMIVVDVKKWRTNLFCNSFQIYSSSSSNSLILNAFSVLRCFLGGGARLLPLTCFVFAKLRGCSPSNSSLSLSSSTVPWLRFYCQLSSLVWARYAMTVVVQSNHRLRANYSISVHDAKWMSLDIKNNLEKGWYT